jgi:excinuclease UvrABC nuclease subunit
MIVTWSGFYNLNEDAVSSYVPSSPGVYILWVKLNNGNWRAFYVGKARDLKNRLFCHLSQEEENLCLKNHVHSYICGFEFALVGTEDSRSGIEKFLFDHYKPECNKINPGAIPMPINLPN